MAKFVTIIIASNLSRFLLCTLFGEVLLLVALLFTIKSKLELQPEILEILCMAAHSRDLHHVVSILSYLLHIQLRWVVELSQGCKEGLYISWNSWMHPFQADGA